MRRNASPASAEDFCFLVTQRRPLRELDITADGDDARALAADRAGLRRSAGRRSMSAQREESPAPSLAAVDERERR